MMAQSASSQFRYGVALNLHGFYCGLEKIFEKIAAMVDGNVPTATNWHQELLGQMCMDIPEVRPAVSSDELRDLPEDYRGFRHVVGNVYTYHLNPFIPDAIPQQKGALLWMKWKSIWPP